MANSSEKYSNDFKETIKVIFNETECSEWYKEFEKKFNKIKDENTRLKTIIETILNTAKQV